MELYSNGKQAIEYFEKLYGKKTYSQLKRYDSLIKSFRKRFGVKSCYLASSPGRVEFIGNHTDHNGGRVIGCSVNLDIIAAFTPNQDNVIRIYSSQYKPIVFNVADAEIIQGGSIGVAKGVIAYLKKNGARIGGFNACFHSAVPSGAGISSSAAFEVLVGIIQNCLYNCGELSAETLAKAGQYAENFYFNKPSGLLDQSVVAFGGMVALDFSDGVICEKIDSRFEFKLVLIDTGKSHSNLNNLYASIPTEMKKVAEFLEKKRLIEVDKKQFDDKFSVIKAREGERAVLRAKHFFEENERVDAMKRALQNGDSERVLSLINESGNSSLYQLQNCSSSKDDTAISDAAAFVRSLNVGAGVRVHGGGFAGTVLCVVPNNKADKFIKLLTEKYGKKSVLVLRMREFGTAVL